MSEAHQFKFTISQPLAEDGAEGNQNPLIFQTNDEAEAKDVFAKFAHLPGVFLRNNETGDKSTHQG